MSSAAFRRAVLAGLLLFHASLLLVQMRRNFVTVDEVGYVPSGLAHWRTGDFTPYCVNPPPPRMLATLPLLLAHPEGDFPPGGDEPGGRPEWSMGADFATANGPRYFDLVCLARLAGVGWSVLGGWLVYAWARDLYGGWPGCLAAALWCVGPNVLAHAQLVTPDVPAAVAGLAASYAFWHYLRRPLWSGAWLAGLLLGLALLTKFTLLIFYVAWPLLALTYPGPRWPRRLGHAALILGMSLVVLNLGFGFTGTGRRLGEFRFVSRLLRGDAGDRPASQEPWGNRFGGTWLGRLPVPVPAPCLRGIDVQRRDFEARWPSYLAGQWQPGGRWYFYCYTLAVKVPLPTLALVLGGLASAVWRRPARPPWRDDLAVWLPAAALFTFVSSQTGLNYFRYLLPAFPFAAVGAGRLALASRSLGSRAALAGLVLWSAGAGLSVHPHPLAYFNELAGGPANGDAHLIDSNLDWGQDLLELREWLDHHPDAWSLALAYCNHVDPRVLGLDFVLPPALPRGEVAPPTLPPGWYAVSVNFVRGMPFLAPDGQGGFRHIPPGGFAYFADKKPAGRAGNTLFLYHVPPGP